jgi:hypothetical protein
MIGGSHCKNVFNYFKAFFTASSLDRICHCHLPCPRICS